MGWWDYSIMGGDTPWDVAGDVADLLKISDFENSDMCAPDDWNPKERDAIKNAMFEFGGPLKLNETIINNWGIHDCLGHDNNIITQVIAFLAMSAGYNNDDGFDVGFRNIAIRACDDEINGPFGIADDRITVLNDFKRKIFEYDGNP